MPAVDQCEPQVIRALDKAGWRVVIQHLAIRLEGKRLVYADLEIHHKSDQRELLIVEVKCFPDTRSALDEYYHAVGQYMLYRNALRLAGDLSLLYLAIPITIYSTLFHSAAVQATLQEAKIKLIVIDLDREEIVLWLD
jgi:hypothetical protein